MTWEVVIGIETHVELQTQSKMFCRCPVDFGAEPNTVTCPVCLGLPGALPVPNGLAVEWTIALGLAIGCSVASDSLFHRKNYFYADLPKNYQISQFDLPLCVRGHLDIETDEGAARIGVTRVHLEEDTGKSTHVGASGRIHASEATLLDFNRSGVPLMEVVSEPDISSPEQARAYAQELRAIVLALGISDARLEEGSLRFDGNVSLRPEGSSELGTKVEVKNMNSLRSLHRALAFEIERQGAVLDAGEAVAQETRHWDEAAGRTESGRSKEESSDYRYFPEPDLLPLHVEDELIDRLRSGLPELPASRRSRYRDLGLEPAATSLLGREADLGDLFDSAVEAGASARGAANWLTGEVVAYLRRTGGTLGDLPLTGGHIAELTAMTEGGDLSATAAKEVLAGVMAGEGGPRGVAESRDLLQMSDASALGEAVDAVLGDNPGELERLRSGEDRLVGFLVGKVMQATGGKADPKAVTEIIRSRASGGD